MTASVNVYGYAREFDTDLDVYDLAFEWGEPVSIGDPNSGWEFGYQETAWIFERDETVWLFGREETVWEFNSE